MHFTLLQEIIRTLKANAIGQTKQASSARVALRWFMATLGVVELDLALRLQILEGAAGVPPHTWWKEGRRGLYKAKEHFVGTDINPQWLSPDNSGAYTMLERFIQQTLSKFELKEEPSDYITNALMGFRIDMSKDPGKPPIYSAGVKASEGLKNGTETPSMVVAGPVKTFVVRHMQNDKDLKRDLKDRAHNQSLSDEEGGTIDIADTSQEKDQAGQFLAHIVFEDVNDPMGKRIRDFMRKVWADKKNLVMTTWLDMLENKTLPKKKQDFAHLLGMNPTRMSDYFNPAWQAFAKALWSPASGNLQLELADYFNAHGVPWFSSAFDVQQETPEDAILRTIQKMVPLHKKAQAGFSHPR